MKTRDATKFLRLKPCELGRINNYIGQEVVLYECPINGDEASIRAVINNRLFNTDFFDTDDILAGEDYTPVLINNDEAVCQCECSDWDYLAQY